MKPAIFTSILTIAAAATSAICSAASIGQYNHLYDGRIAQRTAPPRSLAMMNLAPTKPLVRPYSEIGVTPQADRMPTAVSYRPFANGPVGSVGLVHLTASHVLDSSALGNASTGQPGAPSQTVGANLGYAFR
jgi:hypothetical protein